ncbi:hypothetical protein PED39_02045 [Methanomassiliicoccales archaeon LGM-RCC1]|nr:hypothetical protein PED39_02045 [Methanomassiliicoccales archaeon LGM-RCC1]
MVTSEELNMTFQKVGNDFGIETKAEFAAFRDLKIKWMRTYKWAEFTVSDFLREAPLEVIEDIAVTIFSKIKGIEHEYSEETVEWLTSDEFVEINQPVYIARDMRIGSDEGEHKSIEDSLNRLKDRKLISEDLGKIRLFWSKRTSNEQSAWSSMLMKVITVNAGLDSEDTPDNVLDFVILRQIAHVDSDFRKNNEDRKQAVLETVQIYPGFDSIQEWLEEHGFSE